MRCGSLNSSTTPQCQGCGKNRTIAPPARPSRKISTLPGAPGSLVAEAERLRALAVEALEAHEDGDSSKLVAFAEELLRVTDIGAD